MDNELQLIACCILDISLVSKAVELGIRPSCFTDSVYSKIWSEMVERIDAGKSVDLVWANNAAKSVTGTQGMGFSEAVADILAPRSEVMSAVEIMLREHQIRLFSNYLNELLTRTQSEEPILLIEEAITQLPNLIPAQKTDSIDDIEKNIRKRLDQGIKCPSGFSKLDHHVKGIEPGVLWVVGGHTSHGKTTLALNIAWNLAMNKHHVTFFSTEMSRDLLITRLATMESGINTSTAVCLTDEEKDAFMAGVRKVKDLPLDIRQTLSLPQIRMIIRKRKSELYIVDYIQMIDPGTNTENEVKRLGYVVRELESMAKNYDVCIIATSQFNRVNAEGPTLSSFRGSGEIEENTDIAILMYYPFQQKSYQEREDMKDKGLDYTVNLDVRKNRIHGLCGTIKLEFDRNNMRIREIEYRGSCSDETY